MPNPDPKLLDKSIKVLSKALTANSSSQDAEVINSSLRGIRKYLDASSKRPGAARKGEASLILASATKHSLLASYLHFVNNLSPSVEEEVVRSLALELSRVIHTIVYHAPDTRARTEFLDLLAQSFYTEVIGRSLLSHMKWSSEETLMSIKCTMNNVAKVGMIVCLHERVMSQNRHSDERSNMNFLLCMILYAKLQLHSHFTSIGPEGLYSPGACSSSRQSHACGQKNAHSSAAELRSQDSQDAFVQQQLLRLHGHLLAAVKLLEPTFKLLTTWQNVRDFLLADDSLICEIPPYTAGPEKPEDRWEHLVDIVQLLLEMLQLQFAAHPLEEIAVEMALDVIMALRVSSFRASVSYRTSLSFVRSLGQQIWTSILKDLMKEANLRLAVRLFFAVQLNLEAMSAFCRPDEDTTDLLQRAAPMEEYPLYSSVRSAAVRTRKAQACEVLFFRHEVTETLSLLVRKWMRTVSKRWKKDEMPEALWKLTEEVLHEEAFEALLERQIRWICLQSSLFIPVDYRFVVVKLDVQLISRLITDATHVCVPCHLSLCATLTKVTAPLIDQLHSVPSAGDLRELCISTIGDIVQAFIFWIRLGMVDSRLSTMIPQDVETLLFLTAALGGVAGRYVARTEMLPAECKTVVCYSVPTLIQTLTYLLKAGFPTCSAIDTASEMVLLLGRVIEDVNNSRDIAKKLFFARLLLECSFIPLLKRIYITAPQEVGTIPPGEMLWRVRDLLYIIKTLTMAMPETCTTLNVDFAEGLLRAGLFEDLLSIYPHSPPKVEESGTCSIPYLDCKVGVITEQGAAMWALYWITLCKVLHTMIMQFINASPVSAAELPELYEMCNIDWSEVPCLQVFLKQGTGSWVVLTDCGRRPLLDSIKIEGRKYQSQYWLAKPSESGEIQQDSFGLYFLPYPELIRTLASRIEGIVSRILGSKSDLPDVKTVLPKYFCPVIPIGCWSRSCENITGHSGASVPTRICAHCRTARYCCRSCQMADWLQHREHCKPWEEEARRRE